MMPRDDEAQRLGRLRKMLAVEGYREQLDLAAKALIAAGQPLLWAKDHDEPEPYWMLDFEPWRPREDDGDALRLAVLLDLDIRQTPGATSVFRHQSLLASKHFGDPMERTRLAILCAAAEIGRLLP